MMEMIEGDGGGKEGRDSRKQNGMEEERISEKDVIGRKTKRSLAKPLTVPQLRQ